MVKPGIFVLAAAAFLAATQTTAATLGLTTSAPTLGASEGAVEYFEFGTDGDLSMFGAAVDLGSALGTVTGLAEIGFGIGFSLQDPEAGLAGGFDIFDEDGLYLAGELLALGQRESLGGAGLIEMQFGNLFGSGAGVWTDTVLMTVVVPDGGAMPLSSFFDGDSRTGLVSLFAVVGDGSPPQIPLPASSVLLLGAVAMLFGRRTIRAG